MPYDEVHADALTEIVFEVDEHDCYDIEDLSRQLIEKFDEPHVWALTDEGRTALFARGMMYEFGEGNTFVPRIGFDFRGAIEPSHPHAVAVDWTRRDEAIRWALDNIGEGAFLKQPDGDAIEEDWVVTWQGVGFAMTEPRGRGEFIGQAPEVFFFKDKAKAALFRTFVG